MQAVPTGRPGQDRRPGAVAEDANVALQGAIAALGLPPGVVNLVNGSRDVVNAIKAEACDHFNLGGGMVEFVRMASMAAAYGSNVWHGSGVDLGIAEHRKAVEDLGERLSCRVAHEGRFGRRQKRVRGSRVPVTIVTGFLGAGKTTLVRRFLTVKGMRGHSYEAVELGLQIIAGGRYPLHEMATHVFGLADVEIAEIPQALRGKGTGNQENPGGGRTGFRLNQRVADFHGAFVGPEAEPP